MQKTLVFKLGAIGGIVLVLMVVLAMIGDVVSERQNWRDTAYKDIAQSHAGSQKLIGPILVVPYVETTHVSTEDPQTKKVEQQTVKLCRYVYVMPEMLTVDGTVAGTERLDVMQPLFKELQHYYQDKIRIVMQGGLATLPLPQDIARTIFGNLIENSFQHSATKMHIDASVAGGVTMLSFTDNGQGITPANAEKLFTPFFTTKREQGGPG